VAHSTTGCAEPRSGVLGRTDDLLLSPVLDSTIRDALPGAGIHVRTKDQDFAIARKLFLRASHDSEFRKAEDVETNIAYIATEIKTNLDKTMFQEACATARDLRIAVPGARYFLMCEWLDMTPVSTAPTDIEQVLLLRGGKRLGSQKRKDFGSPGKRKKHRGTFEAFLKKHPFRADVFERWAADIVGLLGDEEPIEEDVLTAGYF